MKSSQLLKTSVLVSVLVGASTVQAQDDAKLDQLLQLVETMKAEQDALRAEIEALKSEKPGTTETAAEPAKETVASPVPVTETPSIKREGGWIASVHPTPRGKEQASVGRMVIEGFPMRQNLAAEKFKMENNDIGYRSKGEIKINDEGMHSFTVRTTNNSSTFKCSFRFDIEGQTVFDIPSMGKSTHSAEVDLQEGMYTFTMYQWCQLNDIVWEMSILEPSAMNPVPLTSEYFFHRVK
jgi:outer membrane murein-binding lipoprotein Lpp